MNKGLSRYIKRNLPKTKPNLPFGDNSIYKNLEIKKYGKTETVELGYETLFIENYSKLENILNTFEKFYNINVTNIAPRKKYNTPQLDEIIVFNQNTEYFLIMGIDFSKPKIYFSYNKDNQKIRETVADFVFLMLEK
ncbi:hypothetical protein GW932_01795 [archaeon]|nr:hypothetical protein [archaeon]